MKLYFSPGACSMAPHIVLREAGLEFSLEQVDLRSKRTAGGVDYLQINPKGSVPALDINGVVLTEVAALVQYLADLAPDKQLAPAAGSLQRYQLMGWLNYIASEVHKAYAPLFSQNSAEVKAAAVATLHKRFSYLDDALEGRDYLMGERYTVADAYLFVILNWAGVVHIDLAAWPRLQAFHARVAARPAVQQAMQAEGLGSK
jgi:glutathione S-transferase